MPQSCAAPAPEPGDFFSGAGAGRERLEAGAGAGSEPANFSRLQAGSEFYQLIHTLCQYITDVLLSPKEAIDENDLLYAKAKNCLNCSALAIRRRLLCI